MNLLRDHFSMQAYANQASAVNQGALSAASAAGTRSFNAAAVLQNMACLHDPV